MEKSKKQAKNKTISTVAAVIVKEPVKKQDKKPKQRIFTKKLSWTTRALNFVFRKKVRYIMITQAGQISLGFVKKIDPSGALEGFHGFYCCEPDRVYPGEDNIPTVFLMEGNPAALAVSPETWKGMSTESLKVIVNDKHIKELGKPQPKFLENMQLLGAAASIICMVCMIILLLKQYGVIK